MQKSLKNHTVFTSSSYCSTVNPNDPPSFGLGEVDVNLSFDTNSEILL